MQTQEFGCARCWPDDARKAWDARGSLRRNDDLIDESHFHVMILACPPCGQRYLSVFTETIDWSDGDDPQYWTILPITEAEAASLVQQRASLDETSLNSLGHERRSLWYDHPQSKPASVSWGSGIFVGPHD